MAAVREHEVDITGYALERLADVPDLTVYGPSDPSRRGGAVSFELADIHAHDVVTFFYHYGSSGRAGHQVAKPLMRHLEVAATARASFYVYNTHDDVDRRGDALMEARKVFGLDA